MRVWYLVSGDGGGGWCWAGGDKENQLLYVLVFKVLNQISEIEWERLLH